MFLCNTVQHIFDDGCTVHTWASHNGSHLEERKILNLAQCRFAEFVLKSKVIFEPVFRFVSEAICGAHVCSHQQIFVWTVQTLMVFIYPLNKSLCRFFLFFFLKHQYGSNKILKNELQETFR